MTSVPALYRRALKAVRMLPLRPLSEYRTLWAHVRATFNALRSPPAAAQAASAGSPPALSAADAVRRGTPSRPARSLRQPCTGLTVAPSAARCFAHRAARNLTEMLERATCFGPGNRERKLLRAMTFVRFQQPLPSRSVRLTKGSVGSDVSRFYADYDAIARLVDDALDVPLPQPFQKLPPVRREPRSKRPGPGRPRRTALALPGGPRGPPLVWRDK